MGLSTSITSPSVVVMRYCTLGAVVIRSMLNSRSSRSCAISMCSRPEKSAAEAEAQRDGIFRLVEKCGVVQLQFAERVAQHFVIAGVHGKKPGEDHGLDGFEAGQAARGPVRFDDRVAHARVGHALDVGDDEAHVARRELFAARRAWA